MNEKNWFQIKLSIKKVRERSKMNSVTVGLNILWRRVILIHWISKKLTSLRVELGVAGPVATLYAFLWYSYLIAGNQGQLKAA